MTFFSSKILLSFLLKIFYRYNKSSGEQNLYFQPDFGKTIYSQKLFLFM